MALHDPNNKDLEFVLAEVGEKPRTLEQNLNILKNWLSCQPHLPHVIDDNLLAVFLRGCKHNIERTKQKLDRYYTGRAAVPELFSNRDPFSKEIQEGSRVMNIYPLPDLSPGGYRVTMHRFHSFDPNQLDVQGIFKYLFMLADIRILEETPISGDIYLFDLQDIVLSHCVKLATPLLRKTLVLAQEAFPQRLKEIHVFNAPPFVDWILNFFKPVMKEKMRNRFHVHNGHETLYKYVPQHILPTDYGGEGKSAQEYFDDWMKKLQSYQEWFKKQENVKADEKKRPKKDQSYNSSYQLFGYEDKLTSPRSEAVAIFCLVTGHNLLGQHLHRIGIVEDPYCSLCNKQIYMDWTHFRSCTSLSKNTRTEAARYWEEQRLMQSL